MKAKNIKTIALGILFLTLFVGTIHAFVFPQETRCVFVDFYDFETDENLCYRTGTDKETIDQLKKQIKKAESRVGNFWGEKTATPKFVYCQDDEDYKKFGNPYMTPACTHMKIGSYVVISKQGLDLDIISHEISHAELFQRIGFFDRLRKIPTWFDEGLAMQVDLREYYSTEDLKTKTNNLQDLPNVKKLTPPQTFYRTEQVMLNYSTARYTVEK